MERAHVTKQYRTEHSLTTYLRCMCNVHYSTAEVGFYPIQYPFNAFMTWHWLILAKIIDCNHSQVMHMLFLNLLQQQQQQQQKRWHKENRVNTDATSPLSFSIRNVFVNRYILFYFVTWCEFLQCIALQIPCIENPLFYCEYFSVQMINYADDLSSEDLVRFHNFQITPSTAATPNTNTLTPTSKIDKISAISANSGQS